VLSTPSAEAFYKVWYREWARGLLGGAVGSSSTDYTQVLGSQLLDFCRIVRDISADGKFTQNTEQDVACVCSHIRFFRRLQSESAWSIG
jgi:hypothetical protein